MCVVTPLVIKCVCEMAKTYIHKEVAKTVTMFYDANVELYEPLLKFKITMLG